LVCITPAQVPPGGRVRDYNIPLQNQRGERTVIKGKDAEALRDGKLRLFGIVVEEYRGETRDLIIEAADGMYDPSTQLAWSTNQLSVRTGDGRFEMRGRGFLWNQGTSTLIISNEVHTVLGRQLLQAGPTASTSVSPGLPAGSGRAPARTTPAAAAVAEETVEVSAARLEYRPGLAIYTGGVLVREPGGTLASRKLTVVFPPAGGGFSRIEAEQEVVLNRDGYRATGDRAIYTQQPEEIIRLVGNARWVDGPREGSAALFVLDRKRQVLRAEGQAHFKLPRSTATQSGFLTVRPATVPAPSDAAGIVELKAEYLTMTNDVSRTIVGETNVVVLSPSDQSRATAGKLIYSEAAQTIELLGEAVWEIGSQVVRGERLLYNRELGIFEAQTNAVLKLPVGALAKTLLLSGDSRPTAGLTNYLEVAAPRIDYRNNLLEFHDGVQADLLEGDFLMGRMTSRHLSVTYSNQIQNLLARSNVLFRQILITPDAPARERTITCEQVRIEMRPNGQPESLALQGPVTAEQREESEAGVTVTRLSSAGLNAWFSARTNQIERAVADGNIWLMHESTTNGVASVSSARGDNAVYTATNEWLQITGDPIALFPQGRITEADALIWDRLHQRFIGRGKFKSFWKRNDGGTNQAALLPAQSQ
jgi:lipopolysaccharide export system protein LptA